MPVTLRTLLWICSTTQNYTFQKEWLSHKYLTQEACEQALLYVHGPPLTRTSTLEAVLKMKFEVIQAGLDRALQRATCGLCSPQSTLMDTACPWAVSRTRALQLSGSKWSWTSLSCIRKNYGNGYCRILESVCATHNPPQLFFLSFKYKFCLG